ncbi:MAG: hypothetical protein M1820_005106 [Bogoriella megaspora]|nr:MAG: hypothetical protein M1820_005106 [Bogoriella megaspora]
MAASVERPGKQEKLGLQELRQEIPPRFLFRCGSATSGGLQNLDTEQAITPRAHALGVNHRKYQDIPNPEVMVDNHLQKRNTNPDTEFSSWSASSYLVFCYAYAKRDIGEENVQIAIIDTTVVKNAVFHGTKLKRGGMTEYYAYWEFLVHGIVEGPGFLSVPFKDILREGVDFYWEWIDKPIKDYHKPREELFRKPKGWPITIESARRVIKIGTLFGPSFAGIVAVSLLAWYPRSGDHDSPAQGIKIEGLDSFIKQLRQENLRLPRDLDTILDPPFDIGSQGELMGSMDEITEMRRLCCNIQASHPLPDESLYL